MIILPDRRISRSTFLLPVPKSEWILPSDFTYKDQFNNSGIRHKFFITGRLDDGHIAWSSSFDDREDFDAFLYALHHKTLKTEKALWKLPTNEWHDGLNEGIKYEFASGIFYTIEGAGTFTAPTDWNSGQNIIYAIGAGGSGCATITTTTNAKATGGGGGECRLIQNFSTSIGSVINLSVGVAPTNVTFSSAASGYSPGGVGSNTTFNSTTLIAVYGNGGQGTTGTGNVAAVSGGTGGTGTFASAGGNGGAVSGAGSASGGGGGAGVLTISSPTSTTTVVGNSSSDVTAATSFGRGGSGAGGEAGVLDMGAAGTSSYNNGGNGGNASIGSNINTTAGRGGTYGAGGGGVSIRSVSATRTATPGRGAQGMISVVYVPGNLFGFGNPPVMGL